MLDLGDLVDMLQRDLAAELMTGVLGSANAVLPGFDIGGVEKEVGNSRGAEVEGERSVGTDSDTGGNGDAGVNVSCAGIEFLVDRQYVFQGNGDG